MLCSSIWYLGCVVATVRGSSSTVPWSDVELEVKVGVASIVVCTLCINDLFTL